MNKNDDSDFLAHFEEPYHRGRLAEPSATHHLRDPVCGDWVEVSVRLGPGGMIEAAYFQGQGCMVSQASASLICRNVEGMTLGEVAALDPVEMLAWVDIPLMPRRKRCALLPFRALKVIAYRRFGLDPA